MPAWSFLRIPELPREIVHQDRTARLVEWRVAEGAAFDAGAPLVRFETWWARAELRAAFAGILGRQIFNDLPWTVPVGDPFAVAYAETDAFPTGGRPLVTVDILGVIRRKPGQQ